MLPVKLAHKRHPPLHVFLLFHVHAQPEDGDDNIFIAVTKDDNAPLTSHIIIGVATDITLVSSSTSTSTPTSTLALQWTTLMPTHLMLAYFFLKGYEKSMQVCMVSVVNCHSCCSSEYTQQAHNSTNITCSHSSYIVCSSNKRLRQSATNLNKLEVHTKSIQITGIQVPRGGWINHSKD